MRDETQNDLLEIANDINNEGWAETLAGIIFGDEEMKQSGIRKREYSREMISCLTGEPLASCHEQFIGGNN